MGKAIYLGIAVALVSTAALAQDGMRGHGRRGGGAMLKMADANKDGTITWAEAQAASNARFARLDANKDGSVTTDERLAAMRAKRKDTSVTSAEFAARAKARFDRLDSNKDGKIDSVDLAALKARREARRS